MATHEQRTNARILDRAADNAELRGKTPATSRQCWFLGGLLAALEDQGQRDLEPYILNTSSCLTKYEASQWISDLTAKKKAQSA